nr:MAG TPA: hypothetical protein [Caudoviricetes sp.]
MQNVKIKSHKRVLTEIRCFRNVFAEQKSDLRSKA